MRYRITNATSGLCLGVYAGDSPAEALDAMARDAGYSDHAHATRSAGPADLVVEEAGETRMTYTVREPGCVAWESGLPTLAAAGLSLWEARQSGLLRAIVVREPDGAIVTVAADWADAGRDPRRRRG
jgi:hypothetical protein